MGCWQLGNQIDWGEPMSDHQAIDLVQEALELGTNLFDTSPAYGAGQSERLLGKALGENRHQVIICTKFGYDERYQADFSSDGLINSLQGSLDRLQTHYVDVLLMHSPPKDQLINNFDTFETLEKLKRQGSILHYGASVDSSDEIFWLLENTQSTVIEVGFNVFHQEPEKAFDAAYKKGVSIISKIPLDSGWLSGKYHHNSQFSGARSRWSVNDINKRSLLLQQLEKLVDRNQLVASALAFSLDHPAIVATIPGCKNEKQLKQNLSVGSNPLNPTLAKQLRFFSLITILLNPLNGRDKGNGNNKS